MAGLKSPSSKPPIASLCGGLADLAVLAGLAVLGLGSPVGLAAKEVSRAAAEAEVVLLPADPVCDAGALQALLAHLADLALLALLP